MAQSRRNEGHLLVQLFWLHLLALLMICTGCGGDKERIELSVRFVQPAEDGMSIGCGDDVDDRASGIQYRAVAQIELDVLSAEAITASLSVVSAEEYASLVSDFEFVDVMEQFWPAGIDGTISSTGRIDFDPMSLPAGETYLLLDVRLDGRRLMRAVRQLQVNPDPLPCAASGALRFVQPFEGQTISALDDLDQDLSNGLQVEVKLAVTGDLDGPVTLTYGEAEPLTAEVSDGFAVFPALDLPLQTANYELKAAARTVQGLSLEASAFIFVAPGDCQVKLLNTSNGVCDVVSFDDLDPELPGIQIELAASSNCPNVTFVVNGDASEEIQVLSNLAKTLVTLKDGQNLIYATAHLDSMRGRSEMVTLVVEAGLPSIEFHLSPNAINRLGIAQLRGENLDHFVISGTAERISLGTPVFIQWTPDDPEMPEDAVPDQVLMGVDGYFELPVRIDYGCGQLQVSATDLCNQVTSSARYSVCFDRILPEFSITSASGNRILPTDDLDPVRPGLQVAVTLKIQDERPDLQDYLIDVVCGRINDEDHWTSRLVSKLRRNAAIDQKLDAVLTFGASEKGDLACKVVADSGINGNRSEVFVFKLLLEGAIFHLLQPELTDGQACAAGQVVLSGEGADLEAYAASLSASALREGSEEPIVQPLTSLGNGQYETVFDLEEGLYRVTVSGETAEEAVVVDPPGLQLRIDRTPPALSLENPQPGLISGTFGSMGCLETALTLQAEDASATEICYQVNGSTKHCGAADETGRLVTPEIYLFREGANTVRLWGQDCAGNESESQAIVTLQGCAPRLDLLSPVEGQLLAASADLDPEQPGFQWDVRIDSDLPQGRDVYVTVKTRENVDFGPAVIDEQGQATVRVTVPTQGESDLSFELNAHSGLSNSGWAKIALTFQKPQLLLNNLSSCLNAAFEDLDEAPGLQIAFEGQTRFVAAGQQAQIQAQCGGIQNSATGLVASDGSVRFEPITLPEALSGDETCEITTQVQDLAGQTAEARYPVPIIDRQQPTVSIIYPAPGQWITSIYDEQIQDLGIQVTPLVEVCGAEGQTLHLEVRQAFSLGETNVLNFAKEIPSGDCATVQFEQLTLPEGEIEWALSTEDDCKNKGLASTIYQVFSNNELHLIPPATDDLVNAQMDADASKDGCQFSLQALVGGFTPSAQFAVCSSSLNGTTSELCNGFSNVLTGECRFRNNRQNTNALLVCPVSLNDGVYELRLVGSENGVVVTSNLISLRADCSLPKVVSMTVLQDADGDGCLNRKEGLVENHGGNAATYSLDVEIEGMEDGQEVKVYRDPNAVVVGSGQLSNGHVRLDARSLLHGDYAFYVGGSEKSGNSILQPSEGGFRLPLRVDAQSPQVLLFDWSSEVCFNIQQDNDLTTPGFQKAFSAQARGEPGEEIEIFLSIDGALQPSSMRAGDHIVFETATLSEGEHALALWAVDSCGNAGSLNGFSQTSAHLEDWSRPLTQSFKVDTRPPHPLLSGLVNGVHLEAFDDADQNGQNGFQTDVTVSFAAANELESGQEVRILSNGSPVKTSPNSLIYNGYSEINARLTLPPGSHALTAQATDLCGNVWQSDKINVMVDIDGCVSSFTKIADVASPSPTQKLLFGPAAGNATADGLKIQVEGIVSFYSDSCRSSTVQLMLDDSTVLAQTSPDATGRIAFSNVQIPQGRHKLYLLVSTDEQSTPSYSQELVVDVTAPAIAFANLEEGQIVVEDVDDDLPGQQFNVRGIVTEARVDSSRTASLSLNGQLLQTELELLDGLEVTKDFGIVTLNEGQNTLTLCAIDAVQNRGCKTIAINADPEDPSEIFDLAYEVADPRATEIRLTFTAPYDDKSSDGEGRGKVTSYEIYDDIAQPLTVERLEQLKPYTTVEALVDAGQEEQITVSGLKLNEIHHIGVRALDDALRPSDLATIDVDLRMKKQIFNLSAMLGKPWADCEDSGFWAENSMLKGRGDFNGDGLADVLVVATQYDAVEEDDYYDSAVAVVILGNSEAESARSVNLLPPRIEDADMATHALAGVWAGDVNGDGLEDIALLGMTTDYEAFVSLYWGCSAPCEMTGQPDAVVHLSGHSLYLSEIHALGNFIVSDGEPQCDDLLVGVLDNGYTGLVISGHPDGTGEISYDVLPLIEAPFPHSPKNSLLAQYAAGAGDLNGDGIEDLLISVDLTELDVPAEHFGYLLWGEKKDGDGAYCQVETEEELRSTACNAAIFNQDDCIHNVRGLLGRHDLNGDGQSEFLVSDYLNKRIGVYRYDAASNPEWTLEQCISGPKGYGSMIDWAGDVNGDGCEDVIASYADEEYTRYATTVRYGHCRSSDPLSNFWIGNGQQNEFDVHLTDGADWSEKTTLHLLGLAGVGDFNGDQRDDVAHLECKEASLRVTIFY